MKTMRQTADGGLPRLRQKTPDAHEETSTLSERKLAPVAFNLNHCGALCLPLVTDSKKFIWVHSNQIDLQMDGAAEMNKAFDRFPYLTHNQTVALARRCSLHPDQVKVWFMVQRLHYGISWEFKDIVKVQRKFKSSLEKKGLQNDGGKNKKWGREIKESSGKKAVEVSKEMDSNERRMTGENRRANKRLERKMKQLVKEEKDRKVEEPEVDKGNTRKKRKMMTMTEKMGKKRRVDDLDRAGTVEITSDEDEKESTRSKPTHSEMMLFTRKKKKAKANKSLLSIQEWPAHKSFVVPDEGLDVYPPLSQIQASAVPPHTDNQTPNVSKTETEAKLEGELHAESTNPNGAVAGGKLKELMEVTSNVVVDSCAHLYSNTKTQRQLAMIRAAFLHSQYPDKEAYDALVKLIGIPRNQLVQWFNDMRYYIKKAKPRWMNEEQHSQVLANITFRQWLNALPKPQPSEGRGKTTWKMKLERS